MQRFKTVYIIGILGVFIFMMNIPVRGQATAPEQQPSGSEQAAQTDTTVSSGKSTVSNLIPQVRSIKSKEWRVSFSKIIISLILILITFVVIKYFTRFVEMLGERWGPSRLIVKRAVPILRISGWTVIIYFIIAVVLAPPIETLIAVTASAGIAIGFASQDILKNIFGGIMILFDRPFQVGDKIAIGNHYGEVIQIGLRTVRIVTADDSVVSIPNGEIVNQSVSNSNSGAFNCQVVSEFYLPADIDLIRLKKICYLAAAVSKYAYLKKPIAVVMKNEITEGRSLIKVRLKAYVFDIRFEFAFSSEMTELVISQILKEKLVTPEALSYFK